MIRSIMMITEEKKWGRTSQCVCVCRLLFAFWVDLIRRKAAWSICLIHALLFSGSMCLFIMLSCKSRQGKASLLASPLFLVYFSVH
ncbi:hypothetical protein M747DRAFT_21306 [Aspergillus niger ATCC 13496]|uniref:Uncharacterized protein n=1 Tax=Aspergillus niger ATCC 13496 TaxID=1353008 RepID=A0A370C614_ASPNG|nr:hypothetical protein M747DRAFT_21306 [Aspergillus niger ATCC 13496]